MPTKPPKPRKDFPLYPHAAGYWAKKIKGKTHYFGKWDNPNEALKKYLQQRDYLESGLLERTFTSSTSQPSTIRLGDGCNLYLDRQLKRVDSGEIGRRSYNDCRTTLAKLLTLIDRETPIELIQSSDWATIKSKLATGRGPTTLANDITRIRMCCNWLVKHKHIQHAPDWGDEFNKPPKRVRRREKRKTTIAFQAAEIQTLLKHSNTVMRAMILLGVNCGFGNADCSYLLTESVHLENGWVDQARSKTGIDRRAKLWSETIDAIRSYLDQRPPIILRNLFVTSRGNVYSNADSAECAISRAFSRLCVETNLKIAKRGFYGLRRSCESAGGRAKDQVALNFVMGHVDQTMGGEYREWVDDDRLEAVSKAIHDWLFSTVDLNVEDHVSRNANRENKS